jgi:acyl-CoA thioester hydrolase
MFRFETQVRVRYAETDKMGFVYYGNYAAYYEVARVESLRSLGITYRSMEESGIIMPVMENYSKFILPAQYDDLLTITVMLKEKPSTRIRFDYEIYNQEKKLINLGFSTLVFVDMKTSRPVEAPVNIVEILKPFFNGI